MQEKKKTAGVHTGHRQRIKEEFRARSASFPDHKVLEILLFFANPRGDTNPIAHELLERFGSIAGVLDALPEDLQKVSGVGEHAADLLKTVKEVATRYFTARTDVTEIIYTSQQAIPLLQPYFFGARGERAALLCLDAKGKPVGIQEFSQGSVNSTVISPRAVVEAALARNATQVILAHNHVSGLAVPSHEDWATTKQLAQVLRTVDVRLLDHLIFIDDDMVSLRDSDPDFDHHLFS